MYKLEDWVFKIEFLIRLIDIHWKEQRAQRISIYLHPFLAIPVFFHFALLTSL